MTRLRLVLLLVIVLLLLLGGAAWWYLFGANSVMAAELVPTDTVAFATIPNAADIVTHYQDSKLKTLVDDPNMQPVIDKIRAEIGTKNLDLINAFLPNLSGQSFLAVTHIDTDQPAKTGFIAGMKPKPGLGNFDAFVEKLKAAYPDELKKDTTGTGNVAGVDYQWIQGPGEPEKICVAQVGGWIVTALGEATLQDWVERYQKKASTPSLAQNPDYQKSMERVGKNSMALTYLNSHALLGLLQTQMAKTNPATADFVSKKLDAAGGMGIGTSFENGEIVDRFSFLMPHQAQVDAGAITAPCPFETLKFAGHDTRLYWASSFDGQQLWKNAQAQAQASASTTPMINAAFSFAQSWAQDAGLDFQHNIIDPLGHEVSFQVEWSADTSYPEAGLLVKLDKPDDFKPTITAIIDAARKAYANSAVINEIAFNGHSYASLKFVSQAVPVVPTITEDGPYFGLFLSENQAVRSFSRDETVGLSHNADFTRQIGDKRNGATQILFLDSPQLLNRAYQTAMPYLSMAAMFNQTLAGLLKGHDLPPDLTWIAPIGTWSCVVTPDNDGVQAYSVSGIGNQGIFLGAGVGGAVSALQMFGMIPKPNLHPHISLPPPTPPPATVPPSPPAPPDYSSATTNNATAPATPAATPSDSTNQTSSPTSPVTPPDTTTNTAPAPAPESVPAATTTSNVNAPTPDPNKTQ